MNVMTDFHCVLNRVGSRIWELLAKHAVLGEAFAMLKAEFDVDLKVLRRDFLDLVQNLQAIGLLNVITTGSTADISPIP